MGPVAFHRKYPNLPTFPAGTQVALVRQMMLFDNHGNLVVSSVTPERV